MKMRKIVAIVAAVLMLVSVMPIAAFAADTYELATSIEVGDTVVLACTSKSKELSGISTTSTKYGTGADYSGAPVGAYALTVEEGYTADTYSFKCPNGQYLYWTSGNSLNTNATKNENTSWTVTFSGDNAIIKNAKDTARQLQWNASSPRFACYGNSGQTAVQLFKLSGGEEPPVTCEHVWVDADCTTPKTCSLCGKTEGEALGHSYGEAVETVAPDCTNAGEEQSTCSACGDVKTETIAALGHNYVDGVCSVCGEAQPLEITIPVTAITGTLAGDSSSISWQADGFQFITYKSGSTSAIRVTDSDHFRVYAKNKVEVSSQNGQLLKKVQFEATTTDYATVLSQQTAEGWTASVDGTVVTFTSVNGAESLIINSVSAQVRINSVIVTPYVANCDHDYVGVETQAPTCSVEGVMTYTCSKCEESYTEAIATIPHDYAESIVDSTCTATGTATYICSKCGDNYSEEIPMKSHNYVDDVCDVCGAVKAYKGTITFDAEKTQRIEFTTQIQIWENEGLNVTNNKASSTTNVGDYSGRFYKNSEIIISFPEMATLIIDATGVDSDKLWDDTLTNAGLSFTVENKIYTITFAEPVNSIELTCANQVRANSITAIVAHECVYDNDFDADCNVCGAVREVASPISYIAKSVSEDVNGYAVLFNAAVEGIVVKEGTFVQADFTNATCNGYKLLGLGVKASNGVSETTIEGLRMYDLEDGCAKFAFRIVNIPADKLDVEITMTPYYTIEIDGVETTLYGEAVVGSYAEIAG